MSFKQRKSDWQDGLGKGILQINGQTLEGSFSSYGNSGAYRLKLFDGSGAELSVYKDSASSTGKSAGAPHTTNSIAPRVDYMLGNCSKRLKNRTRSNQNGSSCEVLERNRSLAAIEPAQSAIEFIVTMGIAQNIVEVQHG